MNIEELKYPIGEYVPDPDPGPGIFRAWVAVLSVFPENIEALVKDCTEDQLNYRYRPDGWTIKQVVHHLADSHMNGYIRFKLALTEDNPTIRPYHESLWSELHDAHSADLRDSLALLRALHNKWVLLIHTMTEEQFERTLYHPEYTKSYSLKEFLGYYAWHSEHHLAQIENALQFKERYS